MTLRVLIIEDSELDAELMKRELSRGGIDFVSKVVHEKEEVEELFQNWNPDIVLSDYNLVGYTGQDALIFCKNNNPDVPFIAVSGSINKKMELELLRKRANDVLQKDSLGRLAFSVKRAINERKDKRELEKKNKQLENLLKEKEVLVQEVHHRVKNNLALFSGFLELDRMLHTNEEVDYVLSHNILRVKSIAVIHEIIYQTASFSTIPISDPLTKIFEFYVSDSHLEIKKDATGSKTYNCNINQVIPLGLLVNEMLNVSFKKENGWDKNVLVNFKATKRELQISIHSHRIAEVISQGDGTGEVIDALLSQIPAELSIDANSGVLDITFTKE